MPPGAPRRSRRPAIGERGDPVDRRVGRDEPELGEAAEEAGAQFGGGDVGGGHGEPPVGEGSGEVIRTVVLLLITTRTIVLSFSDEHSDRAADAGPPDADGRKVRGDRTRRAILASAVNIASVEGLEGLSIGRLATELDMSKSGLFAHFGSKEELQIATVRAAAAIFVHRVIPAARGALRARARPPARDARQLARLHGARHLRGRLLLRRRDHRDGRPARAGARRRRRADDRLGRALADYARAAIERGELPPTPTPTSSRSSSTRSARP